MQKKKVYIWTLILFLMIWLPASQAWADGGYFSSQSVAVSADQRAIIIKNGNEISMAFSTGYTGEGGDFSWIIPTPVPPAVEDISEAGEEGETAFEILDGFTAPEINNKSSGCFPAGTEVLTAGGTHAIETVEPGTAVYSYDLATGEWIFKRVLKRLSHPYEGDMIGIRMGDITIHATGNHPFYVMRGDRLASRPHPPDVPKEEQGMTDLGRWVEARDLKEGDVLLGKNGGGLIITGLSSRYEKAEVYNLTVEGCHNYTVHRKGILVHNKMGGEQKSSSTLVTVYGRILLEHYEVSILGADDASHIMNWLQENGYNVNPSARDVLDTYIDQNWAFVAVKLNPGEKRHYNNEFLPPLTIRYRHSKLIFPLHISSVSTTQKVKITLYVIAESTVTSSNFPTTTLKYEENLSEWVDPEKYIEACVQKTLEDQGGGLSVMWAGMWGGNFFRSPDDDDIKIIDELMRVPFPEGKMRYLTRLETRMDPEAMTEDICFILDPQPNEFRVSIRADEGWGSELTVAARDGETDRIRKLLEAGADMHAKDDSGLTALMWAFRRRYDDIVDMLLDAGADVNARDRDGRTTLAWAAGEGHSDIIRALLDAGADVNAENEGGGTALMDVAWVGQTEVAKILLQMGADVNARNERGETALMKAGWQGNTDIVRALLEAGADVTAKDNSGETTLMKAEWQGNTDIVRALLEAGADVNAKDNSGGTALMDAAGQGNTDIVRALLETGADVNAKDNSGETALMKAAWQGNTDIVRALLETGADVNAKDNSGETALMKAARCGHTEVVKILLKVGASVNASDKDGWTALMKAARCGHTEVVQLMLQAGADVHAKDNGGGTALIGGGTALMKAARCGHTEVVQLMLQAGANVHERGDSGTTALMWAAWRGDTDIVWALLQAGADVNAKDNDGDTALMDAAMRGRTEAVKILLEAEEDVKTRTEDGWTTLMTAAWRGDTKIVRVLLEAGANVDLSDKVGFTALMKAAGGGHIEVVKILLEVGADANAVRENGWTALMQAAWGGHDEVVKVLLDAEANVYASEEDGWTALMLAKIKGHTHIVDLLKKAGAKD